MNPEAVSDSSSEDSEPEELELKRPRFDSESSDISTASSSCYSVGSNISNFSNFSQLSMMSNVSTLSDGGIFKKPEEKKDLPDAKTKMTGPDMSKLREMKNKQRRTQEYLKLLHQKRKVSNGNYLNGIF